MNIFCKVALRSRKIMTDYLTGHERYHILNPWNRLHSYAHNLKIYKVLPSELLDTGFSLLQCREYWNEIDGIIDVYNYSNGPQYLAFFNGRSGGYLVMRYVKTNAGIDQGETFEDWSMDDLRYRCRKVQEFDLLAQNIINTTIDIARNFEVVEENIEVVSYEKIYVLKARNGGTKMDHGDSNNTSVRMEG